MVEVLLLKFVVLAKLFLVLGAATLALLATTLVGLAVALSLALVGPFFPNQAYTGSSR